MGQASGRKRLRREVAEHTRGQARLALRDFRAMQAAPEVAAVHAADLADTELQERWRVDSFGQNTRLRRAGWVRVTEGADGAGWWAHPGRGLKMIHSVSREADGHLWGHFSMSCAGGRLPDWYELRDMQWIMYPDRTGLQLAVPQAAHVSIAEVAHLWTCLTGDLLPAFGRLGTI